MSVEQPRRRADAARNIAAILDAAVETLAARPDASVGDVAAAAGVSRQTVYAHYPSREALLAAVAERALRQTVEAIDAIEPERGAPEEALDRLVGAWWRTVERHARVLESLGAAYPDAEAVHEFHAPVLGRLQALVERGQEAEAFERHSSPGWLAVAFLALMHAAAEEVASGRLRAAEAERTLHGSIRRLFDLAGPDD